MNSDIRALALFSSGSSDCEVALFLCAIRGSGTRSDTVGRLDLLVGVVDQIFFGGHLVDLVLWLGSGYVVCKAAG